jgi:hypothetical protein
MNLGEPLDSLSNFSIEYAGTSPKRQGLAEGSMVVGLVDSTRSMGKPCTGGSDQQWCTGFSTCFTDTRRLG